MASKKNYLKPELKTRKVELGVFGEYSGTSGETPGGEARPHPMKDITPFNYMVD